MIEERTIELINAGVDGELTESEQHELQALLEQSEEARHYYSELNRLADFLDKVPDRDMPGELHGRILDGFELSTKRSLGSIFNFGELPGLVRYGLAAAAVLLLGVGYYGSREELAEPGDVSSMVGTLIRGGPEGRLKVLDTFSFETDGVSGKISLEQRNGAYVLDVQLDGEQALEFQADFTGDGLKFDAFAQMQSNLDSMEFADQAIRTKGRGRQRFAVLLHRTEDTAHSSGASIKLEFSSEGELIQQGKLELGW